MSEPNGGGGLEGADLEGADRRLFETGNLADATVVCGDRTWNVHKVILGSRCRWFKAAFYGNMAEAASGKVILREQDHNLVDIVLRFIYTRDIEIKQLKRGKGLPSLCVQAFRLADFFLLDGLKYMATKELKSYFKFDIPFNEMMDPEEGEAQGPQWLTEILDAVQDAYKDRSTAPILKTLLEFIYERRHLIFRFKDTVALMDKIPQMANDLMKNHIIGDFTKRQTTFRLGLPVLKATQGLNRAYLAGAEEDEVDEPKYLLYPVAGKSTSPFAPVDSQTEMEDYDMQWITPHASAVKRMTSHPDSPLVLVEMRSTKASPLGVRFDACGDARLYVELYCRANSGIVQVQAEDKFTLARKMIRQFREMW